MFVEQFCAVELLDKLLVDAGLAGCALRAQLNINEVKDPILQLLSISLGFLWIVFGSIISVV